MLDFLYNTAPGRAILKPLLRPGISKVAGAFLSTGLSRPLIKPFIRKNGIDISLCEETRWRSFNDFFVRKYKPGVRPVDMDPAALVSPCDGALMAFPVEKGSAFDIKGVPYTTGDLLGGSSRDFTGGTCLVFRLAPNDYHRYIFFDGGKVLRTEYIPGLLHTVRPVATEKYPVYRQNSRECTFMETSNFGRCVQVEVGALLVGRIENRKVTAFKRGEEKGMFLFGGSTIVLLLERGSAHIRAEILEASSRGEEFYVTCGERIGTKNEQA